MELVILAAVAVALGIYVRKNPPHPIGSVDAYTAWLMRQQKPALHR